MWDMLLFTGPPQFTLPNILAPQLTLIRSQDLPSVTAALLADGPGIAACSSMTVLLSITSFPALPTFTIYFFYTYILFVRLI